MIFPISHVRKSLSAQSFSHSYKAQVTLTYMIDSNSCNKFQVSELQTSYAQTEAYQYLLNAKELN